MFNDLVKKRLLRILITLHLYPHILYTFSPFKIYEFQRLLEGVIFCRDELLLDIGCGLGLQTLLLGERAKTIIGVDISESSINQARERSRYFTGKVDSQFYCRKVEEAGFSDEYFDKVFSFCVIEHISNYKEIFQEVYRILKNKGRFIFSADSLASLGEKEINLKKLHQEKYSVCHYFQAGDLQSLLREIGFRQIEISPSCQSEFARQLFTRGVHSGFHYNRFNALWNYWLLRHNENLYHEKHRSSPAAAQQGEEGLFLIVKCEK